MLCKPQKHGLEPAGRPREVAEEAAALSDAREFRGARWHSWLGHQVTAWPAPPSWDEARTGDYLD